MSEKPGAPKGNKFRQLHGAYPLKTSLVARGLDALDKRSKPYRDLMVRRDAITLELGGADNVTQQQEHAIDLLCRELLFLDQVDSWVMAQDSILTGRGKKKELLPVFKHRDAIVKRATSLLTLLGLERRARTVRSAIDIVGEAS